MILLEPSLVKYFILLHKHVIISEICSHELAEKSNMNSGFFADNEKKLLTTGILTK